jgi:hypothetical protein
MALALIREEDLYDDLGRVLLTDNDLDLIEEGLQSRIGDLSEEDSADIRTLLEKISPMIKRSKEALKKKKKKKP